MIGYGMFGTKDLTRAREFYDPVMAAMGANYVPAYSNERGAWYGKGKGPLFAIVRPYDEGQAGVGNGSMLAFPAQSREEVDKVHALAISLGGVDEGRPGVRGDDPNGFYGAYFRDLDGNKLCVYRMGPP